jgi:hypothetical protein
MPSKKHRGAPAAAEHVLTHPPRDFLLPACYSNDKLIKETQLVWIKYTRSRAECYTHDT